MDMRAEILDLKLRVEELETGVRHGVVAIGRPGEPDRQAEFLREIGDRTRSLRADVAAVQSALADGRVEMVEQFAAVETEVAAIRREVSAWPFGPGAGEGMVADEFAAVRAGLEQEFNSLRSEMTDLGIKLDRLLKREND
ncbi:hypothetical protein E1292_19995 [Nonomuraea deserti]|uniref:Uncharacterized protein n=1 Tax=Nonomuraea deserti TaxID=1848322 RepID=A0A4R4VNT4_9ACTN|nr:hypothetical protein [Nonomuraea deserti]TDD03925.1 hypothetical protein E1292_19995 [Nonomuraea deserti]